MNNESDINSLIPDDDLFVFNHSMEEIYLLSREGTILAANPAAAAGVGYDPGELTGTDYRRIDGTMRFDIPGWADDFIKRISDAGGFTFESIHRCRNGDEKFKRIKITLVKRGNSDCFCIFALDISARMKSELDILRSRERFRNLFEQSFDMIFLVDRNGKIVEWNQTVEKLSGIRKIDAVDRDVWEIITTVISPPFPGETNPDVIRTREKYAQVLEDLKNGIITEELFQATTRTPDGVIHHVEHAFFPVTNPRDSEKMLGNILRDVTLQKITENDLREQQGLLSAIIDHLPFDLWARDLSGRYIFQSAESVKLWGNLNSASVRNDAEAHWSRHCQNAYNGETTHEEISLTLNGASRDFLRIIAPFYSGHAVSGIIGIHIDITEKNRLENEHLKMQKLESLGILAGGIAHDFRNILAAILGNITLSLMATDQASGVYRYLKTAEKSILRAKDLTSRLLTFSKGGDPVKSLASISVIIRESVSLITSGTGVETDFGLDETIPPVDVDRIQISQAVQNIALNAVQAMNGEGRLTIRTSKENVTQETNPLLSPGEYVRITISDTGPGIDDSIREKIFDPYFTTKNHGTGLGLSVVYSVVKKHNGLVDFTSVKGEGTTFTVFIPSGKAHSDGRERGRSELVHGAGSILVVDDDEIVRTVTRELLEQIGYRTETAGSAEEAIDIYATRASLGVGFDAVIMDLSLQGDTDGIDCALTISGRYPEARIIAISGYSDEPAILHPDKHGFSGALTKPIDIAELSQLISRVIGHHSS